MSTFVQEYKQILGNMNVAISDALGNEVAGVVKKAIVKSAQENVYDAYDPDFLSRYGVSGGLLDEANLVVSVSGNELTVDNETPFQHLWGGNYPTENLSDVIESGDPRFNMGNAGSRKFMEPAKEAVIDSGEAVRALQEGLQRNGIDTSGMTFNFE
jgi:hypothetical protein